MDLLSLIMLGLAVVLAVLCFWALIDCVRRPANLFPYIDRKSKTLWLILTGVSAAVSVVTVLLRSPLNIFGIAAFVLALVYLFDLRPKFDQVSGKSSRY